jgi:type VI secretion system secreted protein VgrG
MKPIQSDYRFTFSCAAGDFDVIYFDVTEELSEPFHLRLDLSRMNEDPVSFSDALDNPGTLTFWKGPEPIRYLNGIISFFHQTEAGVRRTRYTAIIEPTYIRAEYYSNLRIFQEKTVPEIIDMVLKRDGVAPIRFELEGEHLAREFCVQYRETDRNFVERLAAEEGMFYYFEHSEGSHTLVFCDHVQMLKSLGRILHNPNISASRTEPSLWYFEYQERVATARHKMRDRFFEMPDYDLEHQKVGQNLDNQQTSYERYDYPGRYKEDAAGKPFNQFRLEHERSDTQVATAVSDDLKLTAGKYITV